MQKIYSTLLKKTVFILASWLSNEVEILADTVKKLKENLCIIRANKKIKSNQMSITELAIKRPLLICVIFLTLIIFGFIGYSNLSYNLLPKFEAPIISVQTIYKGAS